MSDRAIRRTRFYTHSFKSYHRTKYCSYLRKLDPGQIVSFLQFEPAMVGEPISYEGRLATGKRAYFELNSCPRCGK